MFFYKYVHILHNKHYLHYYKKKKMIKTEIKIEKYIVVHYDLLFVTQ